MASVTCIAPEGDSLPTGRRLVCGQTASGVDITHPEILTRIAAGRLVVEDAFDTTTATIPDVMKWVGDDPERAAEALAAESGRPERDQRSTLTDKLAELVANPDTSPEEV